MSVSAQLLEGPLSNRETQSLKRRASVRKDMVCFALFLIAVNDNRQGLGTHSMLFYF